MCLYVCASTDGALNHSEQCVCVCVCVCTGANLGYALSHSEPCLCVCAGIDCARSHIEPCMCAGMHACVFACVHTCVHVCVCVCVCVYSAAGSQWPIARQRGVDVWMVFLTAQCRAGGLCLYQHRGSVGLGSVWCPEAQPSPAGSLPRLECNLRPGCLPSGIFQNLPADFY